MDAHTLLLRQVNPGWVQSGRVTSQAFKPTLKDEKKLSVYDSNLINAEQSWRHYTQTLLLASTGVLAVSVEESESVGLPARSDPTPFPEHAVIDFEGFSNSQTESKAKRLRNFADVRGWLYRMEPGN